uniref:Nd6 protein n=1 Tax=Paramecium tetraurelia TaxID=5888 RepID=Q7Z102_PARTE|nr:nd6 protein [Paramecium tetraurelia]
MKLQVNNRINPDLLFARLAAGVNHCLAIQSEGDKTTAPQTFQLWGWGSNEFQALGKPESIDAEIQPSPVKIYLEHKQKPYVPLQVACGNQHSMVLACSQDQFTNIFRHPQHMDDSFSYDLGFKSLRYDDCVIFSSGSDEFGQQGRMTDKEQSQEEIEEGEQEDDDEDDYNEQEECFRMKGVVESISKVCQISCGANYTLALDIYGSVYSWGEGATGCLGLPMQVDQQRPTRIDFDKIRMKFISAGPSHAASISEGQGSLYTWGVGTYGQLGHGINKSSNVPMSVDAGSVIGKVVEYVSCGAMHTACTTTDGYAHTFGFNKNGQLGTGDFNDRWEPVKVHSIQNFYAVYAKCGGNTTFITTLERLTFAFGSNSKGRLGIKDEFGSNYPEPQRIDTSYFKSKQQFIYQLALSYHYGLALLQSGSIISFGLPFKGILGRDLQAELLPKNYLTNNSMNDDYKQGDDDEGEEMAQNKLNEVLNTIKPDLLQSLIEPKNINEEFLFFGMHCTEFINKLQKEIKASSYIVDVKCGAFHTVALTDAGEVWVWGSNKCMQHGLKDEQIIEQVKTRTKFIGPFIQETIAETSYPSQVLTFSIRENKRVTYLATGLEYVVVVENRRNIYSWGKNDKGQLGLGFVSDFVETPSMLTDLEGFMVKQVSCGEDHTLILDEGGSLYAVGSPVDGKLGLGPKNSVVLQTQKVPFIFDVAKVAVGPHHSMALVIDKKYNERVIKTKANERNQEDNSQKYVIYTWGNGYGGKLGHGNLDNQYYPKLLQTKYSFKDVSAGTNHSGALTIDDQIVVWGVGSYLGIAKPEDDTDDKQHLKSDKDQEAEPYYIVSPIKHNDLATRKYKSLCLGDRYNMAISKQNKAFVWGLFDYDFQEKLKNQCANAAQREKYVEVLMTNIVNTPLCDIQFTTVSCSFNHAVALTENQDVKELFSWGYDGMTGRLGLGYEFINPDKENEMQLQNKNQQQVKKENIKTLKTLFIKPEPLQFINQYLDYTFKQYQLMQLQADKVDDDEDEFEEEFKRKDQKKAGMNTDGFQLNNKKMSKRPLSKRVFVGASLGMIEEGKLICKSSWEQFINESKPDIYRCSYVDRGDDLERVSSTKRVNFFEEKPVDDVYDAILELDQENQRLYKEIKEIHLQEFRKFKDEAMLTIINKVQRKPFDIQFKTEEKDKDKKKEKKTKKHEAYYTCSLCYKIMFTMLQLHPCYFINIFKHGGLSKKNFVDLVMDTFGDISNDKRKYRILINLLVQILRLELQSLTSKKLIFTQKETNEPSLYAFTNLFIQFQGQFGQCITTNLKLIETSVKTIENKLTSGIAKNLKPVALVFSQNHLQNPGCDVLLPKFDGPQENKFFQERVEFIKGFWDEFAPKLTNFLPQDKKGPYDVPVAVRELFLKTYEVVKPFFQKNNQQIEQIQCRMLGLYYQNYQNMFISTAQKSESEKTIDQKAESNFLNIKCFLEMFDFFINDREEEPENVPLWQNITEIFANHAPRRITAFNAIAYGASTTNGIQNNKLPEKIQMASKYISKNEVNKVKDIYFHAIEYSDDIIIPRVKSIYWATKSIVENIQKIKYVSAENQDLMEQFAKSIKTQAVSYLTEAEPDETSGQERIQVKLKTRQLYYTTMSLSLRHCSDCGCYAIESFLRTEDQPPFHRFDQWNPVSLSALLIRIVSCFKNKKDFDDFLAGQNDVTTTLKKKAAMQKEQGFFGNIIKLKEFEKAFDEKVQFNIEQSDEVVEDQKLARTKESKKVLRELRLQIQDRLISVYKYLYNMEKNMVALDAINFELQEKITKFKTEKVGLYNRIISNCYFGMANKELIKQLQSNPVAMVGQIKDAIKQVSTSTEIYENIDVFKKSADQPSYLSIFGSYSYSILQSRKIIDSIKSMAYDDIQRHTKQQQLNIIFVESLLMLSTIDQCFHFKKTQILTVYSL